MHLAVLLSYLVLLTTLLVTRAGCQFYPGFGGGFHGHPRSGFGARRGSYGGRGANEFHGPRGDGGFTYPTWGDSEWLSSHDDIDHDEEHHNPRCPGQMSCVTSCRTRTPFRTYCGWQGGPLVCCPQPPKRQAIQQPPTQQPTQPQQRCGLLEGSTEASVSGTDKILSAAIGGVPLRTAKSSPWMVAVGERSATTTGRRSGTAQVDWYCGGSLIAEQWVLTAAHCAVRRRADMIRVGELDFSRTDEAAAPQDVAVANITIHPEYRAPSFYHDLALLRLREPVRYTAFVKPVCLPSPGDSRSLDGALAVLTGWGHTEFGGKNFAMESSNTSQLVSNCTKMAATGMEVAQRYISNAGVQLTNGEATLTGPHANGYGQESDEVAPRGAISPIAPAHQVSSHHRHPIYTPEAKRVAAHTTNGHSDSSALPSTPSPNTIGPANHGRHQQH